MLESDRSFIKISDDLEQFVELAKISRAPNRVVSIVEDRFAIEHAHEAIEEAYKSEESLKTIILAAKTFGIEAQNALLKVLEESPRNISFIIVAESKSALLATIRSRLFISVDTKAITYEPYNFKLSSLELLDLYAFVTSHKKLSLLEAKESLERLFYQAIHIEKMVLSQIQLDSFDRAMKLINVYSRSEKVFTSVLINFLVEARYDR